MARNLRVTLSGILIISLAITVMHSLGRASAGRVPAAINYEEEDKLDVVSEEQGLIDTDQELGIQPLSNAADTSQQVVHRVKRNRPKIRYNRNKDVVRDYHL